MIGFSKKAEKPGVFNFLGFTFYLGRSKNGYIIPKLKTMGSRMREKLSVFKNWIRENRNKYRLAELWEKAQQKIRGHMAYYGVSSNQRQIERFRREAIKLMFKWLNRRSQRRSLDRKKFNEYVQAFPIPESKIYHKLF